MRFTGWQGCHRSSGVPDRGRGGSPSRPKSVRADEAVCFRSGGQQRVGPSLCCPRSDRAIAFVAPSASVTVAPGQPSTLVPTCRRQLPTTNVCLSPFDTPKRPFRIRPTSTATQPAGRSAAMGQDQIPNHPAALLVLPAKGPARRKSRSPRTAARRRPRPSRTPDPSPCLRVPSPWWTLLPAARPGPARMRGKTRIAAARTNLLPRPGRMFYICS